MATAEEFLSKAASYIGVGGTDNVFNTWYWGRHVYDPNDYPWCAAFQSYVGVHDLGMAFNPSASAAGVAWQGQLVYRAEDVKPGDWVLFNWDGRSDFGWADHIGVVESFDNSTKRFTTIEGNTGNSYGGQVLRVNRSARSGYSVMFFRPPYEKPKPKAEVRRVHVRQKGSPVYRVYFPGTGEHLYTADKWEKDQLVGQGWSSEGVAWTCGDPDIPVYRLYQPGKKHLFTADYDEALTLTDAGWIFEGVDFFASKDGTPVFRAYNRQTGDHLLTADRLEYEAVTSKLGYSGEGGAFSV